jgi:uncharacterized protein (DUF1778 family)
MAHTISIELTRETYEELKRAAEAANSDIESVLADEIAILHGASATLTAEEIAQLSDRALWHIVGEPFDLEADRRLRELTESVSHSEADAAEIEALLDQYNKWVLRRSQALSHLHERNYDVKAYLRDK